MDIKIFQYRNILPPDVSEAGRFLLCIMAFLTFPIGEGAARRILKPVVCDDNAPRLLRELVENGYLNKRETGQGTFFALTAKTLANLDIYSEHKPHRSQSIPDAALLTYRLKGEIVAREVVALAAAVYTNAWDTLSADDQRTYLSQKSICDEEAFAKALASLNVATVDLLPRCIASTRDVVKAVAIGLEAGEIPFTGPFHEAIYRSTNMPLINAMENLDAALRYKMSLAAQRKVPGDFQKCTDQKVRRYLELSDELASLEQTISNLKLKATVLTYKHGEIAVTRSLLESNGIFIRAIDDKTIYFGVLNNAPYGLPTCVLSRRIDICVSLAEQLKLTPFISIYTLQEQKDITKQRLDYVQNHSTFETQAKIRFVRLSERNPKTKSKTIKKFL